MKLYINIESLNENATKNSNEKIYLTIDKIEDLKNEIINYFIINKTWSTLLSFNVVAILDGACNTIEKKYYNKQLLKVIARKERFHFSKGKAKVIWSEKAIIC